MSYRQATALEPTSFALSSIYSPWKTRRALPAFSNLSSLGTLCSLCILFFLCILGMTGCKGESLSIPDYNSNHTTDQEKAILQFTDSLDRVVTLTQRPRRVVALSASYAETWLLGGGSLVGTTSDAHVRKEFTLDTEVATIGTIKDPNSEVILALEPDLVLLSTDIPSHLALSPLLNQGKIAHAFFHVEGFDDYLSMLDICTTLTGRKDLYRANGLEVEQKIISLLADKTQGESTSTYLLLRSYSTEVKAKGESIMVAKMLSDLGLTNLTDMYPSLLEELSMETIVWEDPTYIFVIPMGDEEAAQATMDRLLETNRAFASLDAVQKGRYHLLPKDLFHYKPNNRWGDSYAYLAKLLVL